MSDEPGHSTAPETRVAPGTALGRGLRLRCPRCGKGPLFAGWFRMHARCSGCKLKFERAPGYFLGSAYVNYGLTALTLTVGYVALHYGLGIANRTLMFPLLAWVTVFPLFFFRYARALWLAMDFWFDREEFESDGAP